MMNDDERKGFPSASSFARFELCPGSYQLEDEARQIGQVAHQDSKDAQRGTRIHQWLYDPKSIELGEADLTLAQKLKDRADEQVRRIFEDQPYTEMREKRIWLKK